MIPELVTNQIIALAQNGADAAAIAVSLNIPEESVRLALRANCEGTPADRDISDDQLKSLREQAYMLAMNSDNDSVRAKLTMFLIERDKPRLNNAPVTNIQVINNSIREADKRFAEMEKIYGDN